MWLVLVLKALHSFAFIDRTIIGGVLSLLRDSVAMTDSSSAPPSRYRMGWRRCQSPRHGQ